MTQAGNLQCKKIIHIAAQSNSAHILKQVKRALEKCAKEKLTSISFPAIGTGEEDKHQKHSIFSLLNKQTNFTLTSSYK